ncbi:MAG TPA: hypothetical protein PK177_11035 [Burkholderiaceae bacterium]|nr:hypothetical protein [Burkholderiaceae bacterium]
MSAENLAYTLVQVVHNFGAATVVGAAIAAFWPSRQGQAAQRRLAWLLFAGWAAQAISGTLFGAVSLHFYGQPPDIHGVAVAALVVKIGCAVAGFLCAASFLRFSSHWSDAARWRCWRALAAFGVLALTAAAFLRWYA